MGASGELAAVHEHIDRGYALLRGGDPAGAEQEFLQALELARHLTEEELREASNDLAVAAGHVVQQAARRGEHLRALQGARDARSWLPGLSPAYEASLWYEEGVILITLGLMDLAEEPTRSALELASVDPAANWGGYFNAHFLDVRLALALSRFAEAARKAEGFLREAPWESAAIPADRLRGNRAGFLALAGHAWSCVPDLDGPTLERALADLEGVLDIEDARQDDRFIAVHDLAYLAWTEGRKAEAREYLAELVEGFDPAHLSTRQRVQVASLRDLMAVEGEQAAARGRLHDAFRELLDEWNRNGTASGVGALRYREVRLAVTRLLDVPEDRVLDQVLDIEAVGRLWHALGKPTPDAAEVRRTLAAEDGTGGCLVLLAGQPGAHLIAFDRGRLVRCRLASYDALRDLGLQLGHDVETDASALPEPLEKARQRRIDTASEALASALLPPEARALLADWTSVHLVGRDAFPGLPFELLPLPGGPLGVTHAVSSLPSLSVGVALARHPRRPVEDILLVAGTELSPAVTDAYPDLLPIPAASLAGLRSGGPPRGPQVLEDGAATPGAVLRLAAGVDVLEVLAHGLVDPYRELQPLIALGPDGSAADGLLTMEAVHASHAPPVVVLSCCQSAAGPRRVGDSGASDLGGAFLEAGASTVVLTRARIRLAAGLETTRLLRRGLVAGRSVAESLRAARAELRSREEFASPRDWGLVFAYGLGE